MPATEIDESVLADIDISDVFVPNSTLVLLNDDHNTFEHVITVLNKVMKFDVTRAEQVAFIVHTKGSCKLKMGSLEELTPFYSRLSEQGLTVEIN